MNILSIVGIAVVTAIMAMVLKQLKAEYAVFISIGGGLIILFLMLSQISELLRYVQSLTQISELSGGMYFSVIIKSLGTAFVIQIGADICRDIGEESLAGRVEFAGKIAILLICLPVIKSIIDTGIDLLT